jgi:hypothetical protein
MPLQPARMIPSPLPRVLQLLLVWLTVSALIWVLALVSAGLAAETASLAKLIAISVMGACLTACAVLTVAAVEAPLRWLARLALLALLMAACLVLFRPIMLWVGFKQGLWQDALNYTSVMGLALVVRAGWRGRQVRRSLRQAEQLREAAEQRALATQLSPHTLFNLINTLYATSLTTPERTPGMLLDLASMFRHLARAADSNFVSLADEVAFMRTARTFALARAAHGSQVTLDCEGDEDEPVPPLLLASLFENALKHGLNADGRLCVNARLRVYGGRIEFRVENAWQAGSQRIRGLGLGQALVRRRLAFHYPGRHRYEHGPTGDSYMAEVSLQC